MDDECLTIEAQIKAVLEEKREKLKRQNEASAQRLIDQKLALSSIEQRRTLLQARLKEVSAVDFVVKSQ